MIECTTIHLENGISWVVMRNTKADRIFGYHVDAQTPKDNLALAHALGFIDEYQLHELKYLLENDWDTFNNIFMFKPFRTISQQLSEYNIL